jgi:FkbM family methyltransferase
MLKRTVISTLQPLLSNRVYTVRHGLAKGLKRRGGLGFVPQVGAPPLEEAFLERLQLAGKTVYDVGGYEGVFSLFFARSVGPAGRLVTFEPNPYNYAKIVANVALNGFTNVDVRQIALGAAPGSATLVFPADETARGSLVGDIQAQIRQEKNVVAVQVQIDSLDQQIASGVPAPDFVKIDVEGLELDVLRGMAGVIARRRPALYIEIHGADMQKKLENVTAVVEYLWLAGYAVHHVESGLTIDDASKIPAARQGHLYCV